MHFNANLLPYRKAKGKRYVEKGPAVRKQDSYLTIYMHNHYV